MALHWTEKAHAVMYLGYDLEKRGWRLHGFHRGDPMAGIYDGYDPDSWSGVATKSEEFPGIVLVVYNRRGFEGGGSEPDYPAHQATPEGKFWHLELNGNIVAQGFGLQQSYGYSNQAKTARQRIVDDIEAAAKRAVSPVPAGESVTNPAAGATPEFVVTHERDWTWVKFGAKPSREICDLLAATWGARFSRKRMSWFITRAVEFDAIAKKLTLEHPQVAPESPETAQKRTEWVEEIDAETW